ncbi:hypothetical protein FOZ63_027547 [Perkinsus olseni]|uniref:Uncharacterized protein n=1 Tax=Perkinsus olseni TaxID=32597 RepID=A0A7J6RTH9_PEROL|nr:hypothetical protein FOZ63_027547 [Perkinsus olseni]
MRFIALSVVVGGVLAAFKSKTRGRNEKDQIVAPEEYKDYKTQPDTGRAARPKRAKRDKQKSGDLLKRVWNTVPGDLDGRDCNSRLSRVHRALARRSRKYKLLVDAVGAPLPSAFTSEEQSFFGTSDEEEPRTAYALVKSVCDYLVWEPLLDEDF